MAKKKHGIKQEEMNWHEELIIRRQESIQSAIRNFAVSRHFLCEGALSCSERLIRFYEGVAMSLDQAQDLEKFKAAAAAFRSVTQYVGRDSSGRSDRQGRNIAASSGRILERQALYNLAVLNHRQIIYRREHTSDESGPKTANPVRTLYQQAK